MLSTILVSLNQKETVNEVVLKPVEGEGVKTGTWMYWKTVEKTMPPSWNFFFLQNKEKNEFLLLKTNEANLPYQLQLVLRLLLKKINPKLSENLLPR